MNRILARSVVLGLLMAAVLAPTVLRADLPPLIPRDLLFGNPEKTSPQMSPDAQRLAWLAPDKKDVLQVWVKVVTADKKRGIRRYFWAEDSRTIIYLQDADGDENFHVYGVEGHGFARPENRIDFNARAEAFLAACLGGRSEPSQGEKYPGSTAVVKVIGQ